MIFRDLTQDDIPQLIEWLRQFSHSFEYAGKVPINDECAGRFFRQFIDDASNAAIVAEIGSRPVATLGFTIMPHPWTADKILFKAFWYSAKPGIGLKLLRHIKKICERNGVRQIIVGSMLPNSNELLERMGFRPCNVNYVLELN